MKTIIIISNKHSYIKVIYHKLLAETTLYLNV